MGSSAVNCSHHFGNSGLDFGSFVGGAGCNSAGCYRTRSHCMVVVVADMIGVGVVAVTVAG